MAVGQNQWYLFGVGAPPILVGILVGSGCSLGARDFDPWPYGHMNQPHLDRQLLLFSIHFTPKNSNRD